MIQDFNDGANGYEPIENYGIIGDMNTVALVGLNGAIDFMCYPNFDSPTLFAALLDKHKGGSYRINPVTPDYKSKQLYLPDTNILLTRFQSLEGIGEITDFMPVQELNRGNELIRRVTTINGKIKYQMYCGPRFNYAATGHTAKQVTDNELLFECSEQELHLRLCSSVKLELKDNDGYATFELNGGEHADFILIDVNKDVPGQIDMDGFISSSLQANIGYWKNWTKQASYNGRWKEMVNRSALILKLMTSYEHGSIVAAPTFGLPEEIGGERNWDYRYTWIRDTSFTVYCLLQLGYSSEAEQYMNWIEHKCFGVSQQQALQLMYKLDGSRGIEEHILTTLEGYKGSKPVRIGNAAYMQTQLDIYGELVGAVHLYDTHFAPISYEFWINLSKQIDWVAKNWDNEDEGIWEVRGGKKKFIYSRIMCWLALDRGIKIAGNHSYPLPPEWQEQRDKIFYSIHEKFWNKDLQAFVQYEGADTVDAATLLMPIVGFISPKDPMWLSTLKCIEDMLVTDFLVYRYKNDGNLDGLSGTEGTFSMCTFWYIQCLSMAGQLDKASLYFEKMLGYANHVGLYSEQLSLRGEHLGNYPQAFTHLALIRTAICLDRQMNGVPVATGV